MRHGESSWNLENKFTGWYDCPLSEKGIEEVKSAGKLIAAEGIKADVAHTSLLKRAIRTLWHVLEETDLMWIPGAFFNECLFFKVCFAVAFELRSPFCYY